MLIAGFGTDKHLGIQTQYKPLSPRFGFAYQLSSNTVIRGGFGIFYNAQGSGGVVFYRMHRYPPFAINNAVTVNQFAANYGRVQAGRAPAGVWRQILLRLPAILFGNFLDRAAELQQLVCPAIQPWSGAPGYEATW